MFVASWRIEELYEGPYIHTSLFQVETVETDPSETLSGNLNPRRHTCHHLGGDTVETVETPLGAASMPRTRPRLCYDGGWMALPPVDTPNDYWIKVGGFVLGSLGFGLSLYNLWKARDRYKIDVLVARGPRADDGTNQFTVSIFNTGNKPVSIIEASYETNEMAIGADDTDGETAIMVVPFWVTSAERMISLNPGQGESITFKRPALEQMAQAVHVQIHTGAWFEGKVEWKTDALESAEILMYALRLTLEHWFVWLDEHKRNIKIVEEPNFMAGPPWSDEDYAAQSKLEPFLFPVPQVWHVGPPSSWDRGERWRLDKPLLESPIENREKYYRSEDDFDRARCLMGQIYGNLPHLFEMRTAMGTDALLWRQDIVDILTDPVRRMKFSAELGVGKLYEPREATWYRRALGTPGRLMRRVRYWLTDRKHERRLVAERAALVESESYDKGAGRGAAVGSSDDRGVGTP